MTSHLGSLPMLLLLACAACGGSLADEPGESANAGLARVRGSVELVEGDCMPVTTPERCRRSTPVVTVQVFPVIALVDGNLPDEPNTPAVASFQSSPDGTFETSLPEGRYTFLCRYENGWHPRRWNDAEWAPVEVNRGWVETVRIGIDHATH